MEAVVWTVILRGKMGNSKGMRKMRAEVVSNMFSNIISSIVAKSIILTIFSVAFAVIEGYYIVLLLPLVIYVWNWRTIAFEVFILIHIIEEGLGTWKWYSKIDDRLYLGGIPLNSLHHLSIFTMELKIDAVLAVMESYELNSSTLAGKPISPEQWKKEDVLHKQLFTYDFTPPSHKVLHDGADWINEQLQEKRVIYCHCKSGIGRSASVIAAYYIKYKKMTALDSLNFIRRSRPCIIGPTSRQTQNLVDFEEALRQERKSHFEA